MKTSNEWRVANFDLKTDSKSKTKRKRKIIENTRPLTELTNTCEVKQCNYSPPSSPILSKSLSLDGGKSPIIAGHKRNLIKFKKAKFVQQFTNTVTNKPQNNSFFDEQNENIEFSPTKTDCVNFIHISQSSPVSSPIKKLLKFSTEDVKISYKIDLLDSPQKPSQESVNIELCSSQESSVVTISTNNTSDSMEIVQNEEIVIKKPKKRYKPGSHAYNYQKLLLKQKSDVTLWKHELYLAATSDFRSTEGSQTVCLTVVNVLDTFGALLFECTENSFCKTSLLLPDYQVVRDISLEAGNSIEVHPSYFIKYLNIFNDIVRVFVNVNKIVKL